MEHVNFLANIGDVVSDHIEGRFVLNLLVHVDLHKKLPALLSLSQLNCLFKCHLLLATYIDSCIDVENGRLLIRGLIEVEELLDVIEFLSSHVAAQQELCVVFAVVTVFD